MPPKRAAAKRKTIDSEPPSDDESASAPESDVPSDAEPAAKKRKTGAGKAKAKGKAATKTKEGGTTGKGKTNANASTQPTNKAIAPDIAFAPKTEAGAVRIATWNICGLAAAQKKVCPLARCAFVALCCASLVVDVAVCPPDVPWR